MEIKAIKAVGALDPKEANAILMFSKNKFLAEIIPLEIGKNFFDKMIWWNDPKSKKIVEAEISEGPFEFIVLFYEKS